jgi:hypothetical protein
MEPHEVVGQSPIMGRGKEFVGKEKGGNAAGAQRINVKTSRRLE